jgi:alkaline phosphatase
MRRLNIARVFSIAAFAFLIGCSQAERARNVILFIGDAGGIPTLNAASIHGHGSGQALFIQQMPHLALMETSAADRWVTDSAAGMTAIVTGRKTKNGVIAQSADAVRGKVDGAPLKTILEYAEEHGLSTGVITNTSIADATPAALYAHANDRRKTADIFGQLARPRAGDGPDLVIGGGRTAVLTATRALGNDVETALRARGYTLLDSPAALTTDINRGVALTDAPEFDLGPVVARAVDILARNRAGFFLMVEWDMHTTRLERGLNHVLALDTVIRNTASQVKDDTLIIFTADHSFDLRVRGGTKDEPLIPPTSPDADDAGAGEDADPDSARPTRTPVASIAKPNIRVENGHTGEQVLIAAQGPGAARVRGFIENTDVFRIMMAAYGWDK